MQSPFVRNADRSFRCISAIVDALPIGISAKIARSKAIVVVLTGDGNLKQIQDKMDSRKIARDGVESNTLDFAAHPATTFDFREDDACPY